MVGEVEDSTDSWPQEPQAALHGLRQRTLKTRNKGDAELETDTDTTEDGTGSVHASIEPPSQPFGDHFTFLQSAAEDATTALRIEYLRRAALREAEHEGLHLIVALGTKSGFKGVHLKPGKSKFYQATACSNGKNHHLGRFTTRPRRPRYAMLEISGGRGGSRGGREAGGCAARAYYPGGQAVCRHSGEGGSHTCAYAQRQQRVQGSNLPASPQQTFPGPRQQRWWPERAPRSIRQC